MEQLHTIQLTKRELGLLEFKLRFLYANIDDDVTSDGQSCTGSYPIEKDHYGKDVIASLYRKSKEIVDKNNYSEKDLQLDKSLRYSTNMKSTWPLDKGGRIKCINSEYIIIMELTEQKSLQWDSERLMEQIEMQESRHMRMYALVSYQLQYPDMTIRDFFAMASKELEEQEEELGYYD